MTVTRQDIEHAFAAFVRAASARGADTSHWALQSGSVTYSRPWAVVDVSPVHGGQSPVLFLSASRKAAYEQLHVAARALDLVFVPADRAAGLNRSGDATS